MEYVLLLAVLFVGFFFLLKKTYDKAEPEEQSSACGSCAGGCRGCAMASGCSSRTQKESE